MAADLAQVGLLAWLAMLLAGAWHHDVAVVVPALGFAQSVLVVVTVRLVRACAAPTLSERAREREHW